MQDDETFLTKAKQENQVINFQHIKILLTGSAAAGKTSFCRLLFQSKFSSEYNSTEVMESNQAMSVVNFSMLTDKKEGQIVWLKLDPKHQISHFKSLLQSRMFRCTGSLEKQEATIIQPMEALETLETHSEGSSLKNTPISSTNESQDTISQKKVSISQINVPQNDVSQSSVSQNDVSQSNVVSKILSSEPLPESFAMHKNETVKLITVIDSGGQPEYIHMLPAINNCPTINFVVHDMTKNLDDPVIVHYNSEHNRNFTEYSLHYSNLDMIGLLMSLTTDSLEQPTKQSARVTTPLKSYVGFVGTHKDKLKKKTRKKTIARINDRLTCMIEERNCKFAVLPADDDQVLYPVNNTTAGDGKNEDLVIKQLRKKVESFMDDQVKANTMNNQLPIRWMILELELQQLQRTSNVNYITYQHYKKISIEIASMMEEEVEESLQYFDFLGVLLRFKKVPNLCNYVFINHQWLFDKLALIMHLSPEDVEFHDHKIKNQFINQRLLAKYDLRIMGWKSELPPQYFFDLLDYLKVIATVKIHGIEYYYMPCVLSSTTQYDDKYRFLHSEPLLAQFSSGFLPRGFFCSLVVHLLQDLPDGWDHQLHNTKHFSNVITFCLPDKTFLRLHDKISYLEIQVRHYEGDVDTSYHPKLFPLLCEYFQKVCKKLNFNPEKLQYGFLCHDGDSDDDHIAVMKSVTTPLPNEVTCCRKYPHRTRLGKLHKIWFEKVSDHYVCRLFIC